MAQANRDENQVTTALGSYNGSPIALLADHATGYLKAVISVGTLSAPSIPLTTDVRDEYQVHSVMGTYNGSPITLMADHATGYLKAVIS